MCSERCIMKWIFVIILLYQDVASSLVADAEEIATRPVAGSNATLGDALDFYKYPDKSKEPQRKFTLEEVVIFDGERSSYLYIVYEGKVYDITAFADSHPGGKKPLKQHAGRDATVAMKTSGMPPIVFNQFMDRFRIGFIIE